MAILSMSSRFRFANMATFSWPEAVSLFKDVRHLELSLLSSLFL